MGLPNVAKGVLSNGVAGALLWLVASRLALHTYVFVAVGIQYAVFALHGLPRNSERFYDLSGSATHLALVACALVQPSRRTARQVGCALASVVWCSRLGTFLFLRIEKDGKDGRFDSLKAHPLRFLGAWTIQALWVVLVQLPVILVNEGDGGGALAPRDAALAFVWVAGFAVEAVADVQKFVWRCDPANDGTFIDVGLWGFARQPNYCGEIMLWWGIFLACWPVARQETLTAVLSLLSPLFITLALVSAATVGLRCDRCRL